MPVQVAVRSYMAAGVAMVGATALIAAPLAVPPPEIHLPAIHASSAAVELAALANPIAEWVTVIQNTFTNVAALGQQFQSDPAPILQQILTNQLANAATLSTALTGATGGLVSGLTALPSATLLAAQQLAAGEFSAAVGTLFQAGIGLILAPAISLIGATSIFTDTAQNFANVVAALPNVLLPVGLAAISPIAGAIYSFGDAGQAVIDAARTGDVAGALSALVNIPAIVTNAFLNGYPPQFMPGVFSPLADGGLIANLLNARDLIAQALGAPAPAAAAAVSADAVTALPTASKLVSLAATTTTDVAAVGETASKTAATTAEATATEPVTEATTTPVATSTPESSSTATESATEPASSTTKTDSGSDSESAAASSASSSSSTTSSTKPSSTSSSTTKPSSSTASEASESSTGAGTSTKSEPAKAASTSAGSSTASKTGESKSESKKDSGSGSTGSAGSGGSEG